jgi:hypothetical protein
MDHPSSEAHKAIEQARLAHNDNEAVLPFVERLAAQMREAFQPSELTGMFRNALTRPMLESVVTHAAHPLRRSTDRVDP